MRGCTNDSFDLPPKIRHSVLAEPHNEKTEVGYEWELLKSASNSKQSVFSGLGNNLGLARVLSLIKIKLN